VDSGVVEGGEISGLYDPLVAKLCVWDTDRERARARMLRALDEFEIEGVKTLLGFHKALLRRACFITGETCHGVVESEELAQEAEELSHGTTTITRSADGRFREHTLEIEVDDRRFEVKVLRPEPPFAELARRRRERAGGGAGHGAARDAVVSPMQGTVLAVEVAEGDEVRAGQVICIVEAMKMENEITAHREGLVTGLSVSAGEAVKTGQVICVVTRNGEPEDSPEQ
jgi:acetyl-CoA/propionyl-CoA carboxylase biotin carboxyl carrier protein